MITDEIDPQEAADALFFEVEAPHGFLEQLKTEHMFDPEGWQNLWQAVANLVTYHNGTLDVWASYDLSRIVDVIRRMGQELHGQSMDNLNEFDEQILAANAFLNEIFTTA